MKRDFWNTTLPQFYCKKQPKKAHRCKHGLDFVETKRQLESRTESKVETKSMERPESI